MGNNKAAGFTGWSHGSYPSPRPMYGLEDLHANPTHQVLLVEGEKCKDAAKRLMAGKKVVAMSWMGGGKSLSKTFWKSLHRPQRRNLARQRRGRLENCARLRRQPDEVAQGHCRLLL